MVRRKIEMVAIEDKSKLQVTFSKRRSGLMKKARELSVLCNVDVGLVIFSPTGRAHEFFSGNSLEKILQLHPRPIDADAADGGDRNLQKTPAEGMHLPKDTNLVESVQSMFEGHKVDQLDVTEVTQLELLLDNMLQRTRTRKKTPAEGMHLPKDTNLVESVQSMFEGHKVEHIDVTEVTQLERLLDNML